MTDADRDNAAMRENFRMAGREILVAIPAIPLIMLCLHLLEGPALVAAVWLVATGSFMIVDVVNGRWARNGGLSSLLSNGLLTGLMVLGCWLGYATAS